MMMDQQTRSSGCRAQSLDDHGLGATSLESPHVTLSVLPSLGGKVTSLKTPSGREWLWRNPRLPFGAACYGADFGATLDSGGWDELFPSVTPVTLQLPTASFAVPDHGEFVALPFSAVADPSNDVDRSILHRAAGRMLPVTLERRLMLAVDRPEVRVSVEICNDGDSPLPYLYAAHPLLDASQGLMIDLPAGQAVRVYGGAGSGAVYAGLSGRWPVIGTDAIGFVDLSQVLLQPQDDERAPLALKVFVATPLDGLVRVRRTDGSALTLKVDPVSLPWIGLWINRRGWCGVPGEGYLNLGLEPTTAPTDDLLAAIATGDARYLSPKGRVHYGFEIALTD